MYIKEVTLDKVPKSKRFYLNTFKIPGNFALFLSYLCVTDFINNLQFVLDFEFSTQYSPDILAKDKTTIQSIPYNIFYGCKG